MEVTEPNLELRELVGRLRFDASGFFLLSANALTLAVALWRGWTLAPLAWVYWGQSVIIGLFTFLKIMDLKEFSTEGVKMNGRPVPPTLATNYRAAFFFLFHYGFFHLVYTVFLGAQMGLPEGSVWPLVACLGAFFANHGFSYVYNRPRDRQRVLNLGTVMMLPYARVIPMHVMIVTGLFVAGGPVGLAAFLLLKTGADLIMHSVEHATAEPWPESPKEAA